MKELRLQGISTSEEANQFLARRFVPAFNRRYTVAPRAEADVHQTLGLRDQKLLPETLCRVEQRTVMGDFTVSFHETWYQLLPTKGLAIRPKDPVTVREYPDGIISCKIRKRKVATEFISMQLFPEREEARARPLLAVAA